MAKDVSTRDLEKAMRALDDIYQKLLPEAPYESSSLNRPFKIKGITGSLSEAELARVLAERAKRSKDRFSLSGLKIHKRIRDLEARVGDLEVRGITTGSAHTGTRKILMKSTWWP